jgi:hypothetical protein
MATDRFRYGSVVGTFDRDQKELILFVVGRARQTQIVAINVEEFAIGRKRIFVDDFVALALKKILILKGERADQCSWQ